jgi:8-oxo-dGTP pyrophosphatase MutT (NUDIX family)
LYTIGGAVERGESPLNAIHRELKEEVGVTLKNPPSRRNIKKSSNNIFYLL